MHEELIKFNESNFLNMSIVYGACETFYKKNLNSDELFETCSQCLLAGIERDCMSGWGAAVYVLTPGKIEAKRLKCRQD